MDIGDVRRVDSVAVTWQDIREGDTGKLLCRFAPMAGMLWFRRRGQDTFIDLRPLIHALLEHPSDSDLTYK